MLNIEFAAHTGWDLGPMIKPSWRVLRIRAPDNIEHDHSYLASHGESQYWCLSDGRVVLSNSVVHCECVNAVPKDMLVGVDVTKLMLKYTKQYPRSSVCPIENYLFKVKK